MWTPESVDIVVNTHVHTDHVGWNTKREGDSWVPTFPNARYVIPEADYRYFHPDNADARPPARTENEQARQDGSRIVFADSILPVDEAGQIELWSDDHQISDVACGCGPRQDTRPARRCCGWTRASPPSSSATSPTRPMQLHRPMDPCAFDEDFNAAAVTRKAGADRGLQTSRGGDSRALSGARRRDRGGPRRRLHGRRLARNKRLVDFLTHSRKGTILGAVTSAPDYADQLRAADLRVTRPRVAVLEAVHAHPHADTETIFRPCAPACPRCRGRRCTTCSPP